ncbi:MAG: PqqD family protein [Anaerolineae bacterium]|nr:PqqD family protein [Anaerolineae bacterium]
MQTKQYPKQSKTVHVETLEGELCIYDWQRMQVHNLNPTAARVWELCDGQTTPQEMAAQLHGDLTPEQAEELVWLALKRLEGANLLQNKVVQPAGRKVYSRREMLAKLGVTVVMLPVITSIVAPSPVEAQSPAPGPGPGPGPVCPIVRTANVGTTDGLVGYQFTAFNEGPITDAQITACGVTHISYAWTGAVVPPAAAVGAGIFLAQANNVQANNQRILPSGTGSPDGPNATANLWTGNRDYNGVDVDVSVPETWNVGVLTITLA